MRHSWAVTYRVATVFAAALLAAIAFAQGSRWWDLVGAVLVASAIVDVFLLIAVAIHNRGRRHPR